MTQQNVTALSLSIGNPVKTAKQLAEGIKDMLNDVSSKYASDDVEDVFWGVFLHEMEKLALEKIGDKKLQVIKNSADFLKSTDVLFDLLTKIRMPSSGAQQ